LLLWPQAAVVLLPVLEDGGAVEAGAAAVLQLVVVDLKCHTAPALARMPPLPHHPALERVNAELVARQVCLCVRAHVRVRVWVCVSAFFCACKHMCVRCQLTSSFGIHNISPCPGHGSRCVYMQGTGNALDHLRLLIDALQHESPAVRYSTLGQLKTFMRRWAVGASHVLQCACMLWCMR